MDWSVVRFYPEYGLLVLLALAVGLLFPVARHITNRKNRRQYYVLQGITLVGALVGAKLAFLIGEEGWPFAPPTDWGAVFSSGRSIVGALIVGLLAAEGAKLLLHYPLPPNDRFAALVPFTLAIGRLGCLLRGCCRGAPYDGPWAITYDDGIPRHPAQAYEIVFQVLIGMFFIVMVKRRILHGRVFSVYLMAYGVFRFLTEFIRETPKTWGTLSAYQWLCLLMIMLGASFLLKRTLFPPSLWRSPSCGQEVPLHAPVAVR
jgi:phosphatidylglycerol:prolipoprotein diacylglycerol transferase